MAGKQKGSCHIREFFRYGKRETAVNRLSYVIGDRPEYSGCKVTSAGGSLSYATGNAVVSGSPKRMFYHLPIGET
jgi:hypothetical protein